MLLTVPASFDEEARELTRRAAEQAGSQHVTLLEEPQAAFYAWLESQGDAWRKRIKVGDLVLVCDVGGGTTDFSLITVSEENGDLTLKRVAVGDHILLGGDNMDLALARVAAAERLEAEGQRIDTWQLHGLWHQCRVAKEYLFEIAQDAEAPVTLLGKGTQVGRRHHQDGTAARRSGPRAGRRLLPARSPATKCRRGSVVSGFRSWACRTRPIRHHETPRSLSVAAGAEQSGVRRHLGAAAVDWRVPRTSCSTAA